MLLIHEKLFQDHKRGVNMSGKKTLVKRTIYRIDISTIPMLCDVCSDQRIAVADVALGTEFRTQGSTLVLREQCDIRHASHLTLHFGERGEAYFSRLNGEHVELVHCADLRVSLLDVPSAGH